MLLEQILTQAGEDLSRENIVRQAKSFKDLIIPTAMPGITSQYECDQRHGLDPVAAAALERDELGTIWRSSHQRLGIMLQPLEEAARRDAAAEARSCCRLREKKGSERLRGLVAALLAACEGADPLHKVQINDLSALPLVRQQELKAYERRLVDLSSCEGATARSRLAIVIVWHDQLVLPLVSPERPNVMGRICQARHPDHGRRHRKTWYGCSSTHPAAFQDIDLAEVRRNR